MTTIGFEAHDHGACVTGALDAAEATCRAAKLQFTPVRRRVLEILLERHQAMGAYDILGKLAKEGLGSQPPVAYRALEFLVKNGFAHKIERLNAFTACCHPGEAHAPFFLICRLCDAVAETHTDPTRGELGAAAAGVGFLIERTVIEAEGICPKCRDLPAEPAPA